MFDNQQVQEAEDSFKWSLAAAATVAGVFIVFAGLVILYIYIYIYIKDHFINGVSFKTAFLHFPWRTIGDSLKTIPSQHGL